MRECCTCKHIQTSLAVSVRAAPKRSLTRLAGHGENLALVAFLTCASSSQELEFSVNQKACPDCHEFFKGASEVLRRRLLIHGIILRIFDSQEFTSSRMELVHLETFGTGSGRDKLRGEYGFGS